MNSVFYQRRTLAVLSGAVTGLTGAVAYYILPLVTVEYGAGTQVRNTVELSGYVLEYFFAQSLLYHFSVLVLIPFGTVAVALTLARRAGHVGGKTELTVGIATVVGPVVMVWLGVFIAWVAIAVQAPGIAVFGAPVALVWALILSVGVGTVVTVSAVGGYAVADHVAPRLPK